MACKATALEVGSDGASALTELRKAWKAALAPRADRPPGQMAEIDAVGFNELAVGLYNKLVHVNLFTSLLE